MRVKSLAGYSDADSAAIIALAAHSHSLTSLDLSDCVVTDAALTAVAQGCPRLTKSKSFCGVSILKG
jgi:hypothetical protein